MNQDTSGIASYLSAESTTIEFKRELNFSKAKQWLKTVSAFANTKGGTILVGVTDTKEPVGIPDIQSLAAKTAESINAHIDPVPRYELTTIHENGKDFLVIYISEGLNTPYYYLSGGNRTAYVRRGDQSVPAPPHEIGNLILKGQNLTYDALPHQLTLDDVSFTYLNAVFRQKISSELQLPRDLPSFGLLALDNHLTNAGALLCDQYVVPQSRIFCTSWKHLTKGSIGEDALDDREFEGNILQLLENAVLFIGHHSRKPWGIYGMERKEHPDYPEAGVREAVTNALIHRDYMIVGSEIHIDIYPDRLEITSPGGMVDGTRIQDRDINNVPSMRRNKIISDIFGRLKLMDRRGSGFERMIRGYAGSDKVPEFISDVSSFRVVFPNMNYQTETADTQPAEVLTVKVPDSSSVGQTSVEQVSVELSPREEEILSLLRDTPMVSIRKLAEQQNLSVKEVRTVVSSLRKKGFIEHVGANNGGFWKIL